MGRRYIGLFAGKSEKVKYRLRIIAQILLTGSLFFYLIRMLDYRNELYVLHDEFGYWGIAAKYAGYDWSGLMQESGYYSFGYSLWLVPLFLSGMSAAAMYKSAVVLNGILICASFLLLYRMFTFLWDKDSKTELFLICMTMCFYPYLATQVNYGWTEIPLFFLYTCVSYLAILFFRKPSAGKLFGLIAAAVYLFFVHQRSIGVCIALVIVLFCYFMVEFDSKTVIIKNWKKIVIILVPSVLLISVFLLLKAYSKEVIFASGEKLNGNDFSGQIGKIKGIFTVAGIKSFFISLIGKLYYLGAGSFLLVIIGMFSLIRDSVSFLYKIVKKSVKGLEEDYIKLFFLLSFLGMLAITTIATRSEKWLQDEISGRSDALFYGRYLEFVLVPVMIYGLKAGLHFWKNKLIYFISVIIFIFNTLITQSCLDKFQENVIVDLSTTAFNHFYMYAGDYKEVAIRAALIVILVSSFFFMAKIRQGSGQKQKLICFLTCGFLITGWTYLNHVNDESIVQREEQNQKYVYPAVKFLTDAKEDKRLCYIRGEETNKFRRFVYYIQYNLYDTTIETEIVKPEQAEIEENTIYIVMKDSELDPYFVQNGNKIYENGVMSFYEKKSW